MGMINTEVQGDLASVTKLADWLRTTFTEEVDAAVNQVYKARTNTEADWEGPAANQFRGRMSSGGKKADQVTEDGKTGFKIAEDWVRGTDKHKKQMQEVRDRAAAAGLTVTHQGIVDPGPGPANPTKPAADAPQNVQDQYATALAGYQAHAKKVAAYQRAVQDIGRIRKDINNFQLYLQNLLDDVISKPHLQAAAFANDTLVAKWAQEKARKLDLRERSIRTRAQQYARANPDPSTLRGQPHTDPARRVRTQGQMAKWAARAGKGARVVSKVPYLGLPLAVGIAAWDIEHGKSPSKAITGAVLSTGVGMTVGSVVGGAVGGAVGNVPGVVVGGIAGGLAGLGAGALSDTIWDRTVSKDTEQAMDGWLKDKWDASGADSVYGGIKKGVKAVTPW